MLSTISFHPTVPSRKTTINLRLWHCVQAVATTSFASPSGKMLLADCARVSPALRRTNTISAKSQTAHLSDEAASVFMSHHLLALGRDVVFRIPIGSGSDALAL